MSSTNSLDYPLLILDASSRKIWVGLKRDPNSLEHLSDTADPSACLFALVERLLDALKLRMADIRSIAYCEGPGSMLGIRTAVMAIRTWAGSGIGGAQRAFAYSSLQLGARIIEQEHPELIPCSLICDARRDSWHLLPAPAPSEAKTTLVPTSELAQGAHGPIVAFRNFQRWTKTDAIQHELEYTPESVFSTPPEELLRPVPFASPMSLSENEFKKWTPKIHQAPQT